ncbi:MAG: hypothetical protein H0A75_05830 [Candidatus Methanofishera endochildressiae]|uniref:3-deoxy-D-manno-octulosonic acid transferase n=1 Tax=Candidatus Methanofishera endochildressiae TaxID=2738884 RepID=A0A7Z0MPU5_9GAMM|nr:hypothetical protein [Candidatus Methanofishera endochildressiae]
MLIVFQYLRGIKTQDYHVRWKEYFGFILPNIRKLSGDADQSVKSKGPNALINYFHANYSYKILITTSTEPGYQRVCALQGDKVEHVYLPLDMPDAIARFLSHFQPRIAVKGWRSLFVYSGIEKSIPLFIVNARLSEKSAKSYLKLRFFLQKVFANISGVVVQTEDDAQRYQDIGVSADKITVSGNIKLDMTIPESIGTGAATQDLFPERLIFVVGSTHQGEDENLYRFISA